MCICVKWEQKRVESEAELLAGRKKTMYCIQICSRFSVDYSHLKVIIPKCLGVCVCLCECWPVHCIIVVEIF